MKKYKEYFKTHNVMETGEIIAYARKVKYQRNGKEIIMNLKERKLNPKTYAGHPYPEVANGKKIIKVHQLVAERFLPPEKHKTEINHKDGNKCNNHVSNLERVSPKENMQHAFKLGLKKGRKNEKRNKLSEADVKNIRKIYAGNYTQLAIKYGVERHTIERVVNKKTYKNVK